MNADEKERVLQRTPRAHQTIRMEHLFEEPCPLYEDDDEKINTFTLNITVAILDFLYQGRHFQRFWVLEEIARAPYFAFLSVLHLRESLGLRGQWHTYLMKQHFEQSINETEHLEIMESRGGNAYWIDRFSCQTPRIYLLLDQRGLLLVISSRCLPSLLRNRNSCYGNIHEISGGG